MPRVISDSSASTAPWQEQAVQPQYGLGAWSRMLSAPVVMLVFALVWLGLLQSVALTVPMDNVEQWVWSLSLEWGYYKHPPLPTWLLWLAHELVGRHALTAVALGALCSLASVALMHALLRQLWNPFAAWLAVLATLGITFYSGRLNYYNHNITLMLCVSLTVYCWWQILQNGQTRWWVGLGLAAGLGMLSKYQYVLVVLPSLVCLFWLRPWASRRVAGQLLLALAIAGVLFLPHGMWLLGRAAADGPMAYAMNTSRPSWPGGPQTLAAIQHSGIWLLDLVLNRCLPALLVLLVVKGLLRGSQAVTGSSTGTEPDAHGVTPEKFLLLWGLAPVLSITALGMGLGMDLQMQWGTAFALWLVPVAMVFLRLHRVQPSRRLLWAALGTFVALQLLLLTRSYSVSSAGCCPNNKWRNFDTPAIARELEASARGQVGGRFRVLVGPGNAVGGVAMALPEQPRVLIDGRADISPWISLEELHLPGVVELLPPDQFRPDATRLASGWSWRIFSPDDLVTRP